jgi:hypothetical protein
MNVEAHLAAGWVLAHCAPRSLRESRAFRGAVTFAAMAPDLDAISYVFGERAYATYHHAVGHNLFFGLLVSIVLTGLPAFRGRRGTVLLYTQLAFYSHFFGDYYFTRFPLEAFWPLSHKGYIHSYRIGLDHPINLFLSYFSFVLIILMGGLFKRTPMEFLSPELDHRLVNLLRAKPLRCHVCGRKANETCTDCARAVCSRHGRITRGFRVRCTACHALPVGSASKGVV